MGLRRRSLRGDIAVDGGGWGRVGGVIDFHAYTHEFWTYG